MQFFTVQVALVVFVYKTLLLPPVVLRVVLVALVVVVVVVGYVVGAVAVTGVKSI